MTRRFEARYTVTTAPSRHPPRLFCRSRAFSEIKLIILVTRKLLKIVAADCIRMYARTRAYTSGRTRACTPGSVSRLAVGHHRGVMCHSVDSLRRKSLRAETSVKKPIPETRWLPPITLPLPSGVSAHTHTHTHREMRLARPTRECHVSLFGLALSAQRMCVLVHLVRGKCKMSDHLSQPIIGN